MVVFRTPLFACYTADRVKTSAKVCDELWRVGLQWSGTTWHARRRGSCEFGLVQQISNLMIMQYLQVCTGQHRRAWKGCKLTHFSPHSPTWHGNDQEPCVSYHQGMMRRGGRLFVSRSPPSLRTLTLDSRLDCRPPVCDMIVAIYVMLYKL